jgi:hypothetical protein
VEAVLAASPAAVASVAAEAEADAASDDPLQRKRDENGAMQMVPFSLPTEPVACFFRLLISGILATIRLNNG